MKDIEFTHPVHRGRIVHYKNALNEYIVDLLVDFDRTPPRFGQQQIEVGENPKPRRIIKETHSLCSGCLQITRRGEHRRRAICIASAASAEKDLINASSTYYCSIDLIPTTTMVTACDVPAGVVTGDNLLKLLKHAKDNGYAIPAFNCTT